MVIYIAGPMRGLPHYNFPAFHAAAKRLRGHGHIVLSPAEDEKGRQLNPDSIYGEPQIQAFFRYDIASILKCDAVVVLDGWTYSELANLEVLLSRAIGLPIFKLSPQAELFGELIPEDALSPSALAAEIVRKTMRGGLGKHAADSWKDEPIANHLLKGARHAITAQLQHDGLSPMDNENHINNGLCRLAMAAAKLKESN